MRTPRYAALARALLLLQSGSMPPPPPVPDARARAITAIEAAIAARARRRRAARWATAMVATTAAAAASVFGVAHCSGRYGAVATVASAPSAWPQIVAHPTAGGASVVIAGAQIPLVEGRAVPAGSRIVTPAGGRATLSFSTGTIVALGEGADMSLAEQGNSQVLRLASGSVDLQVAKLAPGERFVVDTVDSEVEVRGTRFHVALADPDPSCGQGAKTRVTVSEGVVVVRRAGSEWRISAGERWPSGCFPPTGSAVPPAVDAPRSAVGVAKPPRGNAPPMSALGEQNNMFAKAASSKRRGDVEAALSGFDRLVTMYPTSPLAESAYVERLRILRAASPERAVTTARGYLARYPHGFARLEAEAIVAGAP